MNLAKIRDFLFRNNSIKQTVAKNTFWVAFGNIVGRLIRAVLIIYAARILGTEGYGIFSYALSFVAIFGIFSDIGVSTVLMREVSKNKNEIGKYISTSFVVKIVLVVIGSLLTLFIGPALTKIPEVIPLLPVVAILVFFESLREFTFALVRAKEKMELEAVINIVTNIAVTVFGLIILITARNEKGLLIAYTIGSTIGTLFSYWVVRSDLKGIFSFFDGSLVKKILVEAWPIGLYGLLSGLMISTDTIMLGWFRNASEIGIYSAAQRPVQILYMLPSFLVAALFPTLARLANQDRARFRSVLEQGLKIIFLISLPIVTGSLILSKGIIFLLFGSEFAAASLSFSILSITLVSASAGIILGNAIFACGEEKFLIKSLTIGFLSNLAFNFLLIPSYGAWGSAISTVLAHLLTHGSMWLKMKRVNYFRVLPLLKQGIVATAVMAMATFLLGFAGLNLIVNVVLSAGIYFLTLIILKEPLLKRGFIASIFN
jgi:O-antigen/teichoic acid export membrane protein